MFVHMCTFTIYAVSSAQNDPEKKGSKQMKKSAFLLALIAACSLGGSAMTLDTVEGGAQASGANAGLYAEATPKVYFVEDFQDTKFEVDKAYTAEEIKALCTNADGYFGSLQGTGASTFTIRQETDGNKYLEISGKAYYSFGYHFGDGIQRLAAFACNYKYPNTACTGLTSVSYHDTSGVLSGGWQTWDNSAVVTDTTNTSWKYLIKDNITPTLAIGLGFSTAGGTATVCVDDIRCFTTAEDSNRAAAWTVKAPATVNFSAGTKHGLDVSGVTVPESVHKNIFYHNDVENSSMDLNAFLPEGAPEGYTFVGWSLTDGGSVIKFAEYAGFKVHGDMTLYAVWEDRASVESVNITFVNPDGSPEAVLPGTNGVLAVIKDKATDLSKYALSTSANTYEFVGWSLTDGGEVVPSITPSDDTVLYAVWKQYHAEYYGCLDFEEERFEVDKAYTADEFAALFDGESLSFGKINGSPTFTVRKEENGNKYLEVSGASEDAFGYTFDDGKDRFAAFSFNYKYPADTGYKGLTSVSKNASGILMSGGWQTWNHTAVITDTTKTDWTSLAVDNISNTVSIGLGFSTAEGTATVYVDDIKLWKKAQSDRTNATRENVRKASEKASITFDLGSRHGLDLGENATCPQVATQYYIHYTPGYGPTNTTVDLSAYAPIGAHPRYRFVGWSLSDGGALVKDCEYTSFKLPGDITFYAVWEEDTNWTEATEKITYTFEPNGKKGVAAGTIRVSDTAKAGYTNAEIYFADNHAILEHYTAIDDLTMYYHEATYTFKTGKAIPKGATQIAVRFYGVGASDEWAYCGIPENNRFDIAEKPLFTFYAISDLHLQTGYYEANRNTVVKDIQNNAPDFVVINGDLVNNGTAESFAMLDAFLKDNFNEKGIPAFITNGNHEFHISDTYSTEYARNELLNSFATQLGVLEGMGYDVKRTGDELWYSTVIDGVKFIFMSTPTATQAGVMASTAVTGEQLTFLDAELADGEKAGLPTFVVTHMPLEGYTPGATSTVTNTDDVKAILNKYSGVVVVSGHTHSNLSYDHAYVKLPENGDTFTHINEGCAVFLKTDVSGVLEKTFTAGQIIEVYPDKVIFKARRFDANGCQYFGHGEYVWYTSHAASAPGMTTQNSIRLTNEAGLRFAALAPIGLTTNDRVTEFGFVTTRKSLLDDKGLTEADLVCDMSKEGVVTLSGAAYKSGTDGFFKRYTTDSTVISGASDTTPAITAVLTGIPEEGYAEDIVVKTYVTCDGVTYYGNSHTSNLLAAAKALAASEKYESLSQSDKQMVDQILKAETKGE